MPHPCHLENPMGCLVQINNKTETSLMNKQKYDLGWESNFLNLGIIIVRPSLSEQARVGYHNIQRKISVADELIILNEQ